MEILEKKMIDGAIKISLLDTKFSTQEYYEKSKSKTFPFELITIKEESKTLTTAIYERKSDKKRYKISMISDGFTEMKCNRI